MNNIQRNYLYLAIVALLVIGLGYFAWSRTQGQPYARPVPNTKWTRATTEPDLKVYRKDTGTIETMKFEKYIEGVVAGEMEPTWPLEALKAQAIIARTFTIEELERTGGVAAKHPGADVSTDPVEFQAYNASAVNDNVRRAVQETRGQIITYQGKPARTWFHSDAGGQTATPIEGLGAAAVGGGNPPYVKSVKTPWTGPETDWSATFSKEEVRAAAKSVGQDPGDFTTIAAGTKGPSGRALTLTIGSATVPAPEFRLAIGPTRMKSTLLTSVTLTGDRVMMKGKGNGHGVGVSQWAAKAMADQGKKAQDIINYFFSGVKISKLWP